VSFDDLFVFVLLFELFEVLSHLLLNFSLLFLDPLFAVVFLVCLWLAFLGVFAFSFFEAVFFFGKVVFFNK